MEHSTRRWPCWGLKVFARDIWMRPFFLRKVALSSYNLNVHFPGSSADKESTCNTGDPGSIPGLGRSPGEGIGYPLWYSWASLMTQTVNNLPTMRETWFGKIHWRRAWRPTLVFLPGDSSWTEEPGGLQSMGLQRVGDDWVLSMTWTCGITSFYISFPLSWQQNTRVPPVVSFDWMHGIIIACDPR